MKRSVTILIALLLTACTAPLDINTRDAAPRLSVYCAIDDSTKIQRVSVTSSSPYFDNEPIYSFPTAIVRVSGSDGTSYDFDYVGDTICAYLSKVPFGAVAGTTYTLSVRVDFDHDGTKEEYLATSTTLPPVAMDSIWVQSYKLMGLKHYLTFFSMVDPPEMNYYMLYLHHNGVLRNGRISQVYVSRDDLFNGQHYTAPLPFGVYESRESAAAIGGRYGENMIILEPGDTLVLQTANIEKGYLEFLEQCQQALRGSNPMFGGPPSNITTNISGGAVGYFATYTLTGVSTIVKD